MTNTAEVLTDAELQEQMDTMSRWASDRAATAQIMMQGCLRYIGQGGKLSPAAIECLGYVMRDCQVALGLMGEQS